MESQSDPEIQIEWIELGNGVAIINSSFIEEDQLDKLKNISLNNEVNTLCEIMKKFGSDKGCFKNEWHNYTKFYYPLFLKMRNNLINIFEVGLGTNNLNIPFNMGINGKVGASLYGWRDFFPKAHVYGADIDTSILFQDDRIKTFYVDQFESSTIQELTNEKLKDISFDIIIDDGYHSFEANSSFLTNFWHKLKLGGIYIIEDIRKTDENLKKFKNFLSEYEGFLVSLNSDNNNYDNILGVIFKSSNFN